jgi:hypothetical protein
MVKLYDRTDSEITEGARGREDERKRNAFSKWLLAPGFAAAIALGAHGCGNDVNVDIPIPIPPHGSQTDGGNDTDSGHDTDGGDGGMDADVDADAGVPDGGSDGGADAGDCVPVTPVCTPQTVEGLLTPGERIALGDYNLLLENTDESGGEQRAIVDIRDSCDLPIADNQAINEDTSLSYAVLTTPITIRLFASQVTISPHRARLMGIMECAETTDGGVTDGGATDADSDMDADTDTGADTGMDADTDADVDLDGGSDAGTDLDGGVDADVDVDADTDHDGGTVTDGGTDTDGGSCTPMPPVCTPQTVSAVLHAGGASLPIGDFRLKLAFTYEALGDQWALVDLNNMCDVPELIDQEIQENGLITLQAVPGEIEVDVTAEDVLIGAQTARITGAMRCLGGVADGGVTDGGTEADGGTVTDGGTDTDGGTVTDGGVTDGGAETDGGTEPECIEATTDNFEGYIVAECPQAVNSYQFEYLGKNGTDALFRITSGGAIIEDSLVCPMGLDTVVTVDVDNKRISVVPISANITVVHANIHVTECL